MTEQDTAILQRLLDFNADDLAANKRGQLSQHQRAKLEIEAKRARMGYLLIGGGCSLVTAILLLSLIRHLIVGNVSTMGYGLILTDVILIALTGGVCMLLFYHARQTARRLKNVTVSQATGIVSHLPMLFYSRLTVGDTEITISSN